MNFDIISEYWLFIISGVPLVLSISIVSSIVGLIIALISSLINRNKFFEKIISVYIDIFRGTPIYVQLYFFYFGFLTLFPTLNLNKWLMSVAVFSLNTASYMFEILRSGINNIDKGQIEAAIALGVNGHDINKDIIFPQAVRNIFPALMNEFITLTKDTSVVSIIGIHDMMYRFQIVKNQTWSAFEALLIVFLAYLFLSKTLSIIGLKIERKLDYERKHS